MIYGVEGKEFLVNNKDDEEEVASVVMEATRTGGAGFPLLCCGFASTISVVKRGVERAGLMTIVYRRDSIGSCSEVEVGEWLRRRSRGEEQRILIADQHVSRGWEASHVLVVYLRGSGMENVVMRTLGYCALVKRF